MLKVSEMPRSVDSHNAYLGGIRSVILVYFAFPFRPMYRAKDTVNHLVMTYHPELIKLKLLSPDFHWGSIEFHTDHFLL